MPKRGKNYKNKIETLDKGTFYSLEEGWLKHFQ